MILYNTLTHEREEFVPNEPGKVKNTLAMKQAYEMGKNV